MYSLVKAWSRLLCLVCLPSALVLVALSGCAGCCPPPQPTLTTLTECLNGGNGRLAIAVGRRANQPDPSVPPAVEALIAKAAYAEQPIAVVNVDGRPRLEADNVRLQSVAKNEEKWNRDLEAFVPGVIAALRTVYAKEPEADPLTALSLASRFANDGGTVVLLDSGLQTVAPLDFRVAGMLGAEPTDVANFLKETDQLPDFTGRRVVLSGLGDVLVPQHSLATGAQRRMVDVWREIVTVAGATCVEVYDEPAVPVAVTDVPSVSVVAVPEPKPLNPQTCDDIVLLNAGSVGFLPDQAVFREPTEARTALREIADRIKRDTLTVELIGTTAAWGPEDGRQRLSEKRAEAVRKALVDEFGVSAASVTARGVGSTWPGRVPDLTEDGVLLPGPAALNRSVIVRLSGSVCT